MNVKKKKKKILAVFVMTNLILFVKYILFILFIKSIFEKMQ